MRVIEYGKLKPKEVRCLNCSALLEYTGGDIFTYVCRDLDVVKCPICGSYIHKDDNGNEVRMEDWY